MARFGRLAILVLALSAWLLPTSAEAKPKRPDKWKPTVVQTLAVQEGIKPGDVAVVDADCPNGFDVLGGSYVIGGASLFAHAAGAAPFPNSSLYRVIVSNPVTNPFAGIPPADASVTVAAVCAASGTPVVVDGRFKKRGAIDPDDLYGLRGRNDGLPGTVFDRATRLGGIPNGDVRTNQTNCERGGWSVFGGGYTIAGSLWAHTSIAAVFSKTNDYAATIVTPPSNPSLGVFAATATLTVNVLCARDGRPIVFNPGPVLTSARAAARPKKPPRRLRPTVKLVTKKVGGISSGSVRTVFAKCPSGYTVFGGSYVIGGNSALTHPTAAAIGSRKNTFGVTVVNPPANINAGIPRTTAELTAAATCARSGTPIVVDGPFK